MTDRDSIINDRVSVLAAGCSANAREYDVAVNAIRAALADERLVPQWKPIESAPREGDFLVAVNTDDGIWIGRLDRDEDGNWIHEGEPTFCHSYYFEPTHWMPLPQPPSGEPK